MTREAEILAEAAVREAFVKQAGWSMRLSSPFMSGLCATLATQLDMTTEIGRRILLWPGASDASHDSVPLRIAGGLNALVRRGRLPYLAPLYPPHPLPDAATLGTALKRAFIEAESELLPWLDHAPQTNEVARSAVLMAGLLVIADETGLPLALDELGASAGLNLILDRYAYRFGHRFVGIRNAPVMLTPYWQGGEPPDVAFEVVSRRGVDLAPLDVTDPRDREQILAYVWPDQLARIARIQAAIDLAAAGPPAIDRADAADWLAQRLADPTPDGVVRVVMHSIAFQYFAPPSQERIATLLEEAGSAADARRPLAWLRYESDPEFDGRASLRLKLWPGGSDRLLALCDAHANQIEWQA